MQKAGKGAARPYGFFNPDKLRSATKRETLQACISRGILKEHGPATTIYEDGIASAAQKGVGTGQISKGGFAVLELLITIAVLMLVAALLLPALSHGHRFL